MMLERNQHWVSSSAWNNPSDVFAILWLGICDSPSKLEKSTYPCDHRKRDEVEDSDADCSEDDRSILIGAQNVREHVHNCHEQSLDDRKLEQEAQWTVPRP